MPKHFADGTNVIFGTLVFNGTKSAEAIFARPFSKKPTITLTLDDSGSPSTPYKLAPTNGYKSGFIVRFATNFTGNVDWQAMG